MIPGKKLKNPVNLFAPGIEEYGKEFFHSRFSTGLDSNCTIMVPV